MIQDLEFLPLLINTEKKTSNIFKDSIPILHSASQVQKALQNIFVTSQKKSKCSRDSTSPLQNTHRARGVNHF